MLSRGAKGSEPQETAASVTNGSVNENDAMLENNLNVNNLRRNVMLNEGITEVRRVARRKAFSC